MAIDCEYCGASNPDGRLACEVCGNPVRKPAPPPLAAGGSDKERFFTLEEVGDAAQVQRKLLANREAAIQAPQARGRRWPKIGRGAGEPEKGAAKPTGSGAARAKTPSRPPAPASPKPIPIPPAPAAAESDDQAPVTRVTRPVRPRKETR
jgi:hypothetical protein